jgi:hypothetical protein
MNGVVFSESPMGKVQVRFAAGAEHGTFDHDVTLPDGKTFHNPLRVLKNDEGSEEATQHRAIRMGRVRPQPAAWGATTAQAAPAQRARR